MPTPPRVIPRPALAGPAVALLACCALFAGACGGSEGSNSAGAEAPAREARTSTSTGLQAAEEAATRRVEAELRKREAASIKAARKRRAAIEALQAAEAKSPKRLRARARARQRAARRLRTKSKRTTTTTAPQGTTTTHSETAAEQAARRQLEREEAAEAREAGGH